MMKIQKNLKNPLQNDEDPKIIKNPLHDEDPKIIKNPLQNDGNDGKWMKMVIGC